MDNDLIEIAQEIGGIAESNCRYTDGLKRRIEETGKSVTDLTIGELLKIHQEYSAWFNTLP